MNDLVFVGEHLKTFKVQRHYHDNWELIYCTGGAGEFEFEKFPPIPYQEGEAVIIPPGLVHMNNSQGGFTNIHIVMADPTFVSKEPFKVKDNASEHLKQAFVESRYYFLSDSPRRHVVLSALGILVVALINAMQNISDLSEPVRKLRDAIIRNFDNPNFELEDSIKESNFNYDYMRKSFKKEMGMSPLEYMIGLRMKKAENVLSGMSENEYSMAEVAYMCGYDNPLYFSRVFKKYHGISPTTYIENGGKGAPESSDATKVY